MSIRYVSAVRITDFDRITNFDRFARFSHFSHFARLSHFSHFARVAHTPKSKTRVPGKVVVRGKQVKALFDFLEGWAS